MEKVLNYLSQLEKNNNREWYHSNKELLKEANEEFEIFIQELILILGESDNSILHLNPKDLMFKLVRDIRYSYDKSPYNPTFRCCISSQGKIPIPVGYYVSIKPYNDSFIGGGLFASNFKDATKMIRDYISENYQEFDKIINNKTFKENFEVKGEKLKNVPKEYDINNPIAEYLKNKSWYLEYKIEDEVVKNEKEFVEYVVKKFMLMQPFNNFLNKALKDFKMPSR